MSQINPSKVKVLIIGAGPAGLTAGYALIKQGYQVEIIERDNKYVGGISRTIKYKGYRFDIGGHRFFSKNKQVMNWWQQMLGNEFLRRPRLSRWLYNGKFFQYPIRPFEMLKVFGITESLAIVISYLKAKIKPIKPESNLADWCINNFGYKLAKPFFLDYNQKLWGIDPNLLSKDFTLQRIKGISFIKTLLNPVLLLIKGKSNSPKSFISEFNYPKYGPGMMWERTADLIKQSGGSIKMGEDAVRIERFDNKRIEVTSRNEKGLFNKYSADYVLSTMPLSKLVEAIEPSVDSDVLTAARFLKSRDFITVALMFENVELPPDNWIYTHDKGMRCIRVQIYNNWSRYLVPDKGKCCIGFEYVCSEGDDLWSMSDKQLVDLAKRELSKLKFTGIEKIIETSVVRMNDVYPIYELGYKNKIAKIKKYLDNAFPEKTLQPIGRGGLHRYNNTDHSMLTAFLAVKNIAEGANYDQWQVNSEAEYHEE